MTNTKTFIVAIIILVIGIGGTFIFTVKQEEVEYKVVSKEEQATINWLEAQLEEKNQKLKVETMRLELATEINILLDKQKATSHTVLEIIGLSGYADNSL